MKIKLFSVIHVVIFSTGLVVFSANVNSADIRSAVIPFTVTSEASTCSFNTTVQTIDLGTASIVDVMNNKVTDKVSIPLSISCNGDDISSININVSGVMSSNSGFEQIFSNTNGSAKGVGVAIFDNIRKVYLANDKKINVPIDNRMAQLDFLALYNRDGSPEYSPGTFNTSIVLNIEYD